MATLAEIRAQYPQYSDMPDTALADALHSKFYSDMPVQDFRSRIGLAAPPQGRLGDLEGASASVGSANPIKAAPSAVPVAEDMARSAETGLVKGVTGLAGLPAAIGDLWAKGGDAVLDVLESQLGLPKGWAAETKGFIKQGREQSTMTQGELPRQQDMIAGYESIRGQPLHKPQGRAARYTETAAEFVPGAGRKLITMALLPGAASEAAGEATKGTAAEPWARAGAAITTGLTGAALTRPRTAEQALRNQIPTNTNRQTIDRAEALMADAQQRGIRLTWAEALEQVAPGTGLTNMQRTLEATPGSRERMGEFFAGRPAQIEHAARNEFDNIAAPNAQPSTIGPAVGREAENTVNDVRGAINRASEPFYTAAERQTLTPGEMARVRALPGYPEARNAILNDPQLNRYVAGLPENSVGFLNEVKKQLDQSAKNARAPVNAQQNMQRATGYGSDAEAVRDAGTRTSADYALALETQTQLRSQYLDPLLQGPLGRIAEKDITTKSAIDALFPRAPIANSQGEIATAVGALAHRNPRAATDLVRAHVEGTFNEAAKNLQSGANQFGGAKFAKEIAGNPQQRANLEAAVTALPNGAQTWAGFNRFLEIVQATGTRQNVGSKTAYNAQELKDMSSGGLVGNVVKTGASPGKWVTMISEAWGRWQLGRNVDELARILTDPQSGRLLREIARRPQGAREAEILAARLASMAAQTSANKTGEAK